MYDIKNIKVYSPGSASLLVELPHADLQATQSGGYFCYEGHYCYSLHQIISAPAWIYSC